MSDTCSYDHPEYGYTSGSVVTPHGDELAFNAVTMRPAHSGREYWVPRDGVCTCPCYLASLSEDAASAHYRWYRDVKGTDAAVSWWAEYEAVRDGRQPTPPAQQHQASPADPVTHPRPARADRIPAEQLLATPAPDEPGLGF